MRTKSFIITSILLVCIKVINAQVDLPTGGFNYQIPIQSYNDPLSKLNLGLALQYSSGNGLVIDRVASNVGTGWELAGIPKIVRQQNHLPDDQQEYNGANGNGINIYSNGYLYNNRTIGCPETLLDYPIYGNTGVIYNESNKTTVDREFDKFYLSIGGKNIEFVLDKLQFSSGQNRGKVLDFSNYKITFTTSNLNTEGCRTTINSFTVIDEVGIKYEFSERELTKNYQYDQPVNSLTSAINIPNSDNPYQVNTWYITKISDPRTLRTINFTYNTQQFEYSSVNDIQVTFENIGNTTNPMTADINAATLSRTKIKNTIIKKEILSIKLPDNKQIDFNYNLPRLDLPESQTLSLTDVPTGYSSAAMSVPNALSKVTYTDGTNTSAINLSYNYFVKNQIKPTPIGNELYAARLCLSQIQLTGRDNLAQPPYIFDYNVGSNATENFVPPFNYFAKDPWGYYNGDYSAINPATKDRSIIGYNICEGTSTADISLNKSLALNNVAHSATDVTHEIISTVKTNYAQNGLLKQIQIPLGAITQIEYQQNKSNTGIYSQAYNRTPDINSVGGVHVSKVIQKNISTTPNTDLITEYNFINADNTSSAWGFEQPRFVNSFQVYYSEDGCHYPLSCGLCKVCDFKFPGTLKNIQLSSTIPIGKYINSSSQQGFTISSQDAYNIANGDYEAYFKTLWLKLFINLVQSTFTNKVQTLNSYLTYNQMPVNYQNKLPELFKRVEVSTKSSTGLNNGKTVYTFTSDDESPLFVPANSLGTIDAYTYKPRSFLPSYGLTKSVTNYDNSNRITSDITNTYSSTYINGGSGSYDHSCGCKINKITSVPYDTWTAYSNNPFVYTDASGTGSIISIENYYLDQGRMDIKNSTEKIYNKTGESSSTTTEYTYNYQNNFLKSIKSTDSKGNIIEKMLSYPQDYTLLSTDPIYQSMVNSNVLNIPVATETWITKNSGTSGLTSKMLNFSATQYGIAPNGDYKPFITYGLQTTEPIDNATVGYDNYNQLIRYPAAMVPITSISYDALGNPNLITDLQGNRKTTSIYGYNNQFPIASISNADVANIAYTSFEDWGTASGMGKWYKIYGTVYQERGAVFSEIAPTGKYTLIADNTGQFLLANNNINLSSVDAKLSFWAVGTISVKYNSIVITPTVNAPTIGGWTYYEYNIPKNSSSGGILISGSGNSKLDELRYYPANATIATYTYEQGIGKTSESDANNNIQYYEYDGLNRLSIIRDQYKNILKKYCYNYNGQVENCNTLSFTNDAQTFTFTSQTVCQPGYIPATYTYTVPAGKYTSFADKSSANQLAANDLTTNGQAGANALGCSTVGACKIFLSNNSGYTGYTFPMYVDGVLYNFPANGVLNTYATTISAGVHTFIFPCGPTSSFAMTPNNSPLPICSCGSSFTLNVTGNITFSFFPSTPPPLCSVVCSLSSASNPLTTSGFCSAGNGSTATVYCLGTTINVGTKLYYDAAATIPVNNMQWVRPWSGTGKIIYSINSLGIVQSTTYSQNCP